MPFFYHTPCLHRVLMARRYSFCRQKPSLDLSLVQSRQCPLVLAILALAQACKRKVVIVWHQDICVAFCMQIPLSLSPLQPPASLRSSTRAHELGQHPNLLRIPSTYQPQAQHPIKLCECARSDSSRSGTVSARSQK
jgi:hypothetical protein